ncbi:MAG: chemotaxis protein CheC [Clostridiales bacterium]|nr:chemotaxis protein CheC [Clostridiales bacterium]
MAGVENYGDIHFDVLKEIGNIGAGNAITSLSKMLNKKVDMRVPKVSLVDFKFISDFIGGPENLIIGILIGLSGDVNGIMMFLVEKNSAHRLIDILFSSTSANENDDFSEMELSALQEVGNILSGSYLGSFATLINKSIIPSIPYLAIDMAQAILSVPAIEFGKVSDKVLLIESLFEAENKDVSGFFVLVPDPPSFQTILTSLGVMI